MSGECRIYLAGPARNMPYDEQVLWRSEIKNSLWSGEYDWNVYPKLIMPNEYYNSDNYHSNDEKEVFDFDLNLVRHSDVVVALFNAIESIGTLVEISVAYENRIPVVIYNTTGYNLHPWLREIGVKECRTCDELVSYLTKFFLN